MLPIPSAIVQFTIYNHLVQFAISGHPHSPKYVRLKPPANRKAAAKQSDKSDIKKRSEKQTGELNKFRLRGTQNCVERKPTK